MTAQQPIDLTCERASLAGKDGWSREEEGSVVDGQGVIFGAVRCQFGGPTLTTQIADLEPRQCIELVLDQQASLRLRERRRP